MFCFILVLLLLLVCKFVSQCHWASSLTKEPSRELHAGNKSDQQDCANGSPLILKRQTTSDEQAAAGVLSVPARPEARSVSPRGRLGVEQEREMLANPSCPVRPSGSVLCGFLINARN